MLPLPELPARPARDGVTLYWRVLGIAFGTLAGVGFLLLAIGRARLLAPALGFDLAHNLLHAALAALAVALGFGDVAREPRRRVLAPVGGFLVLLALAGLASPTLGGIGEAVGLRFEPGESLLYAGLGAWAFLTWRRA